jgi:magnesium chelatase accessory protein
MDERRQRQEFWLREQATWPHHTASTFHDVHGIRWHLQRMGHGPQVLLVHGTGASTHSWRDLLPRLAEHYSLLAVDLPGHAFSEALPSRRPTPAAMGASLSELLRAVGFAPVYCIGHSAGAAILCQMVLDGSLAPRAIVGINAALLPFGGPARLLFSTSARVLASADCFARLLAVRARRADNVARVLEGTGSRLNGEAVELYRRLVSNPLHLNGALGMMAHWNLESFSRALERLGVPLILLVGSRDRAVSPGEAIEVQRRVAGVRVVPLSGLGHLAHEEAPERVTQEILKVFAELAA